MLKEWRVSEDSEFPAWMAKKALSPLCEQEENRKRYLVRLLVGLCHSAGTAASLAAGPASVVAFTPCPHEWSNAEELLGKERWPLRVPPSTG